LEFVPEIRPRLIQKGRINNIPNRANRLFARVFFARISHGDIIRVRRRNREIVPPPALRFSSLEILTQRKLQPFPAGIVCALSGLSPPVVLVVSHL
jgi:hypothetical protein